MRGKTLGPPEKQTTLSTKFKARPRHPQSHPHKPDLQIARNRRPIACPREKCGLADRIYVGAEPQFNTLRVVEMRPLDETFANERAKRSAPLSVRLHLLDMGVATFAIEHCVE